MRKSLAYWLLTAALLSGLLSSPALPAQVPSPGPAPFSGPALLAQVPPPPPVGTVPPPGTGVSSSVTDVPPTVTGVPSLSTEVPPSITGDDVVAYARTFLGTPYKLGASGPRQFDCSSYTRYVYKHFGYDLTAYSAVQLREGRPVNSYRDLQKGDLVFFGKRAGVRTIGHVGIVVSVDREKGSFTFIHASVSRGVVEQTSSHPYFMMRYIGARRILPDE